MASLQLERTTTLLDGVLLHLHDHALHVEGARPLSCVSSAVVGGGLQRARHILNLGVSAAYRCGNHVADLQRAALALGIAEPFVGLMTAACLADARACAERDGEVVAAAVVTLGISHPTAAGRSECAVSQRGKARPGTINIIVLVDGRLAPGAHINLLLTATEAKSLVLAEQGVRTPEGWLASGTGTDALVVACTERGAWLEYGGPISLVGALVGRAVRAATEAALSAWQRRRHEISQR